MNELISILDPRNNLEILVLLAAGAPTGVVIGLIVREQAKELIGKVRYAHLATRRLFLVNRRNIQRLLSLGIDPTNGRAESLPPDLEADLGRDGQEIADEELSRTETFLLADHTAQLERILKELREVIASASNVNFATGICLGILIAAVAVAIAGAVTSPTGVGVIAFALGVAVALLSIAAKFFLAGADIALGFKFAELTNELEQKTSDWETLLEKIQDA